MIDIIEELKQCNSKITPNFSLSDLEAEEDLKVAPQAHPRQIKPEISQTDFTYENDKTKESLGARNSDLVEIDKESFSSPKTEMMSDIRSKYYKHTTHTPNNDYSYSHTPNNRRPKVNNSSKSNLNKSKSKSKLANSSTPKILKDTRSTLERKSSTKKKTKALITSDYGHNSLHTTSIRASNKVASKPVKQTPSTPLGVRPSTAKSKVGVVKSTVKPKSPKKKPTTPIRPSNSVLEKKFESHLPTTMSGHQATRRKSPRKSPKNIKRPALHEPRQQKSPVRYSQVEY